MKSVSTEKYKLDLHGIRHMDVPREVDKFMYNNIRSDVQFLYIITGYSPIMQEIVIETIKDYGVEYNIGDYTNYGYISIKLN